MGSRAAALLAGYIPKKRPIAVEMATTIITRSGLILKAKPTTWHMM